jgi:hypothetical protein
MFLLRDISDTTNCACSNADDFSDPAFAECQDCAYYCGSCSNTTICITCAGSTRNVSSNPKCLCN